MIRMPGPAAAPAAAAAGLALLAWVEWHSWRASRDDYPDRPATGPDDGRDVVVVLGYRSPERGGTNALQRWRVRIAVRSAPPGALFVFSGGAVHGIHPEAEVMGRYAATRGVGPADIALELRATSTRENIEFTLPWLRAARTIRIASNTLHARRARRHLRDRAPELFARLRPTRDFVLFELGPLRLALTIYDAVAAAVRRRRDAARTAS